LGLASIITHPSVNKIQDTESTVLWYSKIEYAEGDEVELTLAEPKFVEAKWVEKRKILPILKENF